MTIGNGGLKFEGERIFNSFFSFSSFPYMSFFLFPFHFFFSYLTFFVFYFPSPLFPFEFFFFIYLGSKQQQSFIFILFCSFLFPFFFCQVWWRGNRDTINNLFLCPFLLFFSLFLSLSLFLSFSFFCVRLFCVCSLSVFAGSFSVFSLSSLSLVLFVEGVWGVSEEQRSPAHH